MKQAVTTMLDNLESKYETTGLLSKYKPAIDNIRTNVCNKDIADDVQQEMWNKMKKFIEPLDKYRKRNIFDYLPYMKEFY
jgi:hypothetical protein